MPKTSCKLPIRTIVTVTALLLLVALSLTAYLALFGSITASDTVVYVREGQNWKTLPDSLSREGIVPHPGRLRTAAGILQASGPLRPGRYELRKGMNGLAIVSMIKNGTQSPLNITFNNIRTLPQLAATLGRQLHADSASFAAVLRNDSIAAGYGFSPEEFIGMFIPNTYEVYWTVSPEAFVERMHREYGRFWNETRLARLEETGLSAKEVSTLASIVDEETAKPDEMAAIAGVYINRLRRGMHLQADPTVKYALGDFSLRRILRRHLATESPYNTYLNTGLPPGPIRMPSVAAIDAVLGYEKHDYLYFCARADFSGYHSFARTLAEHSRNARAYSAALDRAGIR